jgi:hypothetical protein
VTFQLVNAKVWDGSQWVLAAGGAPETLGYPQWDKTETQVSVTTGGTAHTMGAWVEVVASTSQVWDWVGIDPQTTFVNTADTRTLLDIGIGPSGSETGERDCSFAPTDEDGQQRGCSILSDTSFPGLVCRACSVWDSSFCAGR